VLQKKKREKMIEIHLRLCRSALPTSRFEEKDFDAIEEVESRNKIQIQQDGEGAELIREGKSQTIYFERCFDEFATNYQIFVEVVEPILSSCLRGIHGTVFCCKSDTHSLSSHDTHSRHCTCLVMLTELPDGISSSNKQHTMSSSLPEDPGLLYHSIEFLLRHQIQLRVSVLEIYHETLQDLFQVQQEALG
jgi:hypothetical protein